MSIPHSGPVDERAVRIAVLDDYQDVARHLGPWHQLGPSAEVTVFTDHLTDEEELVARLQPFDVVMAMRDRTPFPRSVLARLPSLRLLITTGMNNSVIDMKAAAELGVVISGTNGTGPPTSELTWALILGLARHVAQEDAAIRDGRWQETLGADLAGATLGVVGLGGQGRRVAKVGLAFDMRVIAWSQNLDPADAAAVGVEAVSKEVLFGSSDVVTIHLRLSDRTRGLVGAEELSAMKPTALLVNTSRGPIVHEEALLDALEQGRIGGAALDVFDTEPLPLDHRLRRAPRTLLTPHLGYVTLGCYQIFYDDAVDDITSFLAGTPVRVLSA